MESNPKAMSKFNEIQQWSGNREMIDEFKEKNITDMDQICITRKWDLMLLLVPGLTKSKMLNQKKNYGKLKSDNMLFMCIEALCQMFLVMVYFDGRPNTDSGQVKTRTFGRLIKMKCDEFNELERELEEIKNNTGVIQEADHDKIVRELNKELKLAAADNELWSDKLINQERMYKEKLQNQQERYTKTIDFWKEASQQDKPVIEPDTHTPP